MVNLKRLWFDLSIIENVCININLQCVSASVGLKAGCFLQIAYR